MLPKKNVSLHANRRPRGDTRNIVLMRAAELFADRGYTGVGLQDIANAAGVKKGSLAAHFDSKRDIYLSSISKVFEDTLGTYTPKKSYRNGKEKLRHYLDWILPAMTKDRTMCRLTLRMVLDHDFDIAEELMMGTFGKTHQTFVEILGEVKTRKDPTALTFFVYAIFILNDELVDFASVWMPNTRKKVGGVKSRDFIKEMIESW